MKFFKFFLVLTVFFLSASFGSPAFTKICTADDYDYASGINHYEDWLMDKECDEEAERAEARDNEE